MAKSVQKLIDEGSDELKRALADLDGDFSPFLVDNQNPEYYYFWAAKNDIDNPSHVDKLKRIGYVVVNTENNSGEVAPFALVATPEGDAIQTSEHVLMRLPMYLHEARQNKIAEIGVDRVQTYKDDAVEKITRAGAALKNS